MNLTENGYTLTEVQIDDLADDHLSGLVALNNSLSRESQPRHVDLTPEEYVLFTNSPGQVRRRFIVPDDGETVVAQLTVSHSDDGSSPNILNTQDRGRPGAPAPRHRKGSASQGGRDRQGDG